MAWSIVGVGTSSTVSSGNATPGLPAGTASGDLLIAFIAYKSNVAFTLPSGWEEIQQLSNGDTDNTSGIASGLMAYIVRGASAPDTTFTRSGGDVAIARIVAYRGNSATPLDTSAITQMGSVVTNASGTGVTTAEADELIVAMYANGDSATFNTGFDATDPGTVSSTTVDTSTAPQSGAWTARIHLQSLSGSDTSLFAGDAIRSTAGATGNVTLTVGTGGDGVMIVAAFKQPGSVGGKIKVYNGASWDEKPVKVWNGSSWEEKPLKVYNGSSWVLA